MSLNSAKVAILATDGFEQSELLEPLNKLREAGASVHVVSPNEKSIRGWDHTDWGKSVDVDVKLSDASPEDYDAVVLPGGQINPDKLRTVPEAVKFVHDMHDAGKPVAAVCHGPWLLVEADLVKGRKVTSFSSIRTDLVNAGANWVDEECVTDGQLITSRNPDDLPAFIEGIKAALTREAQRRAA